MLVALFTVMALVVATPLIAAVLVSIASRREDRACTLAGRPPGLVGAAARQIVDISGQLRE
jgi:hypothetical protein